MALEENRKQKQQQLNEDLKWSVERARAAAEIANIVIWEYNVDNKRLLSYNEGLLDLDANLPFTIDTVIRNIHPDDVDKLLYIFRIFEERVKTQFAVDVRLCKTGEEEWHYTTISGKPLKLDSKGKVLLYAGARVDNTKWKRMNDELKAKNLQLDMALRAGRIVPVMWNVDSDIVHIASLEMKREYDVFDKVKNGLSITELLEYVHPDDRQKVKTIFSDIRSGKKNVVSEEFRYDVKHRYKEYFEANLIVVEDEMGSHFSRVYGYMQDITERKHLLIDLQRAKELAEQSDKLKSAFLANMSHEIRTPLNAIVGFSDMLRESDDQEEKEEYMHIISVNNELLLRLIGDILDLSKIEAGIIERNPEPVDVVKVCQDVYTLIETKMKNPDVRFIVESPNTSCIVCLDEQRLKQIWINFLTNAIKHTKKGYIRMGYQHDGISLRIYVEDTGSGIATELQDRVFGRFQKLNEFEQGTGLGLAISKAIVENVGGNVGFNSEEGVGSTFWASIPCEAKF